MRLTLRTMLAYLDDILEPADRDEIGHKIEESEFATKLVQRIRDCTHKSRLGAPKLSGKAMGLDPNTVAEYLDNTLGGDRVPDFEKVCLESDTHLAEVAASHQILTMVLGQPVDVDPALKRRVYGIAGTQEPPRPIEAIGGSANDRFAPIEDVGIIPSRQRMEVPDYLRERAQHSRWRTIVAAIALVVLLCGAITMALGPLDRTNPVARWFGIGQQPANQVAQNEGGEKQPAPAAAAPTDKGQPAAAPENAAPVANNNAAPPSGENKTADSNATSNAPAAVSNEAASANAPPPVVPPTEAAVPAAPTNPAVTANPTDPTAPHPDSQAAASSAPAAPPVTVPPASTSPGGTAAAAPVPEAASPAPLPADPGKTSPLPPQQEASGSEPPMPGAQSDVLVGRLLPTKGVVLLKLDPASGQWKRLTTSNPLNAGDRLMVLPTLRPTLTLSSGITLQIPSETLLDLEGPDASGIAGVKLHFGRLVLMTTGQSGARLRLNLGAARGVLTFNDAEATLGAEVRRYHPAGADPEAEQPRIAADLYAVSGSMQWTPEGAAAAKIAAPQRIVLAPHPADPANSEGSKLIPPWIGAEQLSGLTKLAADNLELAKAITDDKRPLLLELREMADSRRIECRSLAVQCLALLDQFEPLIKALNDPDERSVWPVHIAAVRSALARGPHNAAKVREAFQKERGDEDGKQLYRMLWGYTRDQLQAGEAAKLVGYLNNDNLDFRVLAFADLQEISRPTFNYQPAAPAVSREGPIMRYQEQLRKGLLIPKEPGTATPTAMPGPGG